MASANAIPVSGAGKVSANQDKFFGDCRCVRMRLPSCCSPIDGLSTLSSIRRRHYDNRGCRYLRLNLFEPDITLSLSTPPEGVWEFSLAA